MFVNLLVCTSIICLALADVKHLSRTYLPPSSLVVAEDTNKLAYLPPVPQEAVQKPTVVTYSSPASQDVHVVPHLVNNEVVENDSQSAAKTKEASSDPAYGGGPFGVFPGSYPNIGFPGQFYPGPAFPLHGFPGQAFPGPSFPPSAGFINSNFPPSAGFVNSNFPPQVFPGQGVPISSFPAPIFPGQGYPAPDLINPGFAAPNYPVYFSTSEQLQAEAREGNADDTPRVRVIYSDTQYDGTNGGYLYTKPSTTI